EPVTALAARNVTMNVPVSFADGVHLSVPLKFPDPVVKVAVLPAGSFDRSAVSELIALPSGSEAVTASDSAVPGVPVLRAGATTTGGWSPPPIVNESKMSPTAQVMSLRLLPDRKSTRLNSSHDQISYAVFCLKKKKR